MKDVQRAYPESIVHRQDRQIIFVRIVHLGFSKPTLAKAAVNNVLREKQAMQVNHSVTSVQQVNIKMELYAVTVQRVTIKIKLVKPRANGVREATIKRELVRASVTSMPIEKSPLELVITIRMPISVHTLE